MKNTKKKKKKIKERQYLPPCKYCGGELPFYYRKFCNNDCQLKFQYQEKVKEILIGKCSYSKTLKKWLINEHGEKCFECDQNSTWKNKPLIMQLDHIDGNSDNNMPENLRLLCPNCHTQTGTFSRRIKKDTKRNRYMRKYRNG